MESVFNCFAIVKNQLCLCQRQLIRCIQERSPPDSSRKDVAFCCHRYFARLLHAPTRSSRRVGGQSPDLEGRRGQPAPPGRPRPTQPPGGTSRPPPRATRRRAGPGRAKPGREVPGRGCPGATCPLPAASLHPPAATSGAPRRAASILPRRAAGGGDPAAEGGGGGGGHVAGQRRGGAADGAADLFELWKWTPLGGL